MLHVITHSSEPASRLIWIYAIGMGAFQGMNAILALFLAARFGVTEHTIGFFFTYIGVISVLTRALILGWAVDRFGEARLSRFGQTLLAIGLAAMPFMHRMHDPAAFAARLGGILRCRPSRCFRFCRWRSPSRCFRSERRSRFRVSRHCSRA